MSGTTRLRWAAVVCVAMIALSASAQESEPPSAPPEEPKPEPTAPAAEEPPPPPKPKSPLGDPPLHRWGGLTISGDAWAPELTNQDLDVAILNDGIDTRVLDMPTDATTRQHWRVWYHLPNDVGSIRFEYDSMRDEENVSILDPGNFVYGELLVIPFRAGLSDDGLADGFDARSEMKTREFRLEYEQVAFDTPKATGSYHVGFRTVDHSRSLEASYYALLPAFPPFLPPIFDETFNPIFLFPLPDSARTTSDFSGSGLGAGFDVEFKFHPRVSLFGSFSIGALRGKIDTRYESTTSAYFCVPTSTSLAPCAQGATPAIEITFAEVQALVAQGQDAAERVFQDTTEVGLGFRNRSRLAYELDISVAAEFKIWRSLTGSVGLRGLLYADVASDLRRGTPVVQSTGTVNFETVSEQTRSVGYEGFFIGVAYRF